jgi:hypothetical protein
MLGLTTYLLNLLNHLLWNMGNNHTLIPMINYKNLKKNTTYIYDVIIYFLFVSFIKKHDLIWNFGFK